MAVSWHPTGFTAFLASFNRFGSPLFSLPPPALLRTQLVCTFLLIVAWIGVFVYL
jgi:hypothetical protein